MAQTAVVLSRGVGRISSHACRLYMSLWRLHWGGEQRQNVQAEGTPRQASMLRDKEQY
jgi:hypothetical protein